MNLGEMFMKVNKALIQIAATHGVSVTDIRRDIQKIIEQRKIVHKHWRNVIRPDCKPMKIGVIKRCVCRAKELCIDSVKERFLSGS